MKGLVLFIMASGFVACSSSKEVQADLVNARLVKIDTVYRYPISEKVLTWKCQNNVQFVSFVKMTEPYVVGTVYRVLLTK